MKYIKFYTEVYEDFFKENLANIKKLRQLAIKNIEQDIDNEITSLDFVINLFEKELENQYDD